MSFGEGTGHIVNPVVVRYDAGGVMRGTDNPAGAALYLDFQLGPTARRSTSSCGCCHPLPTAHDPLAGAEVIDLDVADFVANRTKIADEYNQLVTGS